jgi:2-methylisocitrate lyase-like PEP mutase family enzyme
MPVRTPPRSADRPAQRLRALLAGPDPLVAAGVFDATSARLAENAGFPCLHASGGAIARAEGFPDLGLIGLDEMARRIDSIVETTHAPLVADADTGYGNALNVQRTVRTFEKAGVAGLHLEDQDFPKRCGLYDGIKVIPTLEMAGKIRAAVDARRDRDLVVIARSDAVKAEGMGPALDRCQAYLDAGADMLFIEGVHSAAEIEAVGKRFPGPKLFNMAAPGEPPPLPLARLGALGYRLIIYPADAQRVAIRAMADVFAAILRDGHSGALKNRMSSPTERDELVDVSAYMEQSRHYGA